MRERRMMQKRTKATLGLLGMCFAITAGGVIWQWQNIKAVSNAVRYTKEELAERITSQKEGMQTALKAYGLEGVSDFTLEEEEAIRQGKMTYEEAIEGLTKRQQEAAEGSSENIEVDSDSFINHEGQSGSGTAVQLNGVSVNGVKDNSSSSDNGLENNQVQGGTLQSKTSSKAIVQQSVNQMYALKAKYLGVLGVLERAARNEYYALTGEQRKSSGIKSLVPKYMTPVLDAQSACDAEVAKVLNSLKAELQARGESTDIIKTMKSAYENEKELKKAYYLSLLK